MRYLTARAALQDLIENYSELANESIEVKSKGLSIKESIGNPDRKDFPLLTGREVLVQAELMGELGQAFTSDPIEFSGTIQEILQLSDDRVGNEALIVATLNALARKVGIANHTVHCLNNEPEDCATKISHYIWEMHGKCKVGIIGYQPAILENCVKVYGTDNVAITDLNPDNIGQNRYGVKVLDGAVDTPYLVKWADVFLITGTILANGTGAEVLNLLNNKTVYFYGTTAAALAELNGFKRLCFMSK